MDKGMELITFKDVIMGLAGATGGLGILKNLCKVLITLINRRSEVRKLKMKYQYKIEVIKLNTRNEKEETA